MKSEKRTDQMIAGVSGKRRRTLFPCLSRMVAGLVVGAGAAAVSGQSLTHDEAVQLPRVPFFDNCPEAGKHGSNTELQLEKVRSVEHLIRQIHDNLPRNILCVDPQWLEQQWGLQIRGWRAARGLSELPVPRIDGVWMGSSPLEPIVVRWGLDMREESRPLVGIGVGFVDGIFYEKSLIPIDILIQILGAPTSNKHRDLNPPPPASVYSQSIPLPAYGPYPQRILLWKKYSAIQILVATERSSNFSQISFSHVY